MGIEPVVVFDTLTFKRYWMEVDNLPEKITSAEVSDLLNSGKNIFEFPISKCNMILRGMVFYVRRNRKKEYIVYNVLGDYDGIE